MFGTCFSFEPFHGFIPNWSSDLIVVVMTFADADLRGFFGEFFELNFLFHFAELASRDSLIRAKLVKTKLYGLVEELFELDDVVVLLFIFFLHDGLFLLLRRFLEWKYI